MQSFHGLYLKGNRDIKFCRKKCYSAAILDIMQDSISDLVHIRADPELVKGVAQVIGERAKRARHSQVCSIENRINIIYILEMCSFQHKWASERQLYLFVLLHHVIMK